MNEKVRRLARDQGGFTLIELLVTMVMMTVVMFALYSIFDTGIRVFSFGNDKVNVAENARIGLDKMEREIRAAYPVDKANGKDYLFFSADGSTSDPPQAMPTSTQITFGNDLDGDRKVDCPNSEGNCDYITYRLSSGPPYKLLRNNTAGGSDTSTGGDPVVEHVKSGGLTFTYLKSDGITPATSESDIAIVRISLTIEINRGSLGTRTQTLTTDVALRNRTG